ncbi:MAG: hypothetical protein GVY24_02925 [Planctomycetes bacterium]|jgi:hypothetical protein|nr:hypothetical protein [Planctomycetota bacterium]
MSATRWLIFSTIAIVLCPSAAGFAADPPEDADWLSYFHRRDVSSHIGRTGDQHLQPTSRAPAGVKVPDDFGQAVRYVKWSTPMDPNGFRHAAFASSHGVLLDRLLVDRNGDGRLADETAIVAHHVQTYGGGRGRSCFGPVPMRLPGDDGPIIYHLSFSAARWGPNSIRISAAAACWYEGAVRVDGRARPCQLIDYNANGSFNDVCDEQLNRGSADRIRLSSRPADHHEPLFDQKHFVGAYVRLGDRFYSVTAARDGAYLALRPAKDLKTVSLNLPDALHGVVIYGPQGRFEVQSHDDRHPAPPGRYRFEAWQCEATDSGGRQWHFMGRYFPADSAFDLSADVSGPIDIDIGPPLVASVDRRMVRGGHYFRQALRGRLGEHVSVDSLSGRRRPPAPRLRIVNSDGSYDRTFQFEYG